MSINILSDIKGIGPSTIKKLNEVKIFTLEDLIHHSPDDLSKIDGIGYKSANKWISEAKKLLNKVQEQRFNQQISIKPSIGVSDNYLKQIQTDIRKIFEKLGNIENRLNKLEKEFPEKSINGEDLITSISEHPFIRNAEQLYDIIKKKINKMIKSRLGIQKVSINELYNQIIKDYSIAKEIFAEYLLMLFEEGKLQLETDFIGNGLSVIDSKGNTFKVVRILE